MLATVVWAASASAFAGYYYLQNRNNAEQLSDTQGSLNKLASNYNEAVGKYDLLLSDYSPIYGNASSFDANYTKLVESLGNLIRNFAWNYTSLLMQEDLNESYNQLLVDYGKEQGNVTREGFGDLLGEYYSLFNTSALRELGLSIRDATTLSVSVCVDYGNGTVEWLNGTRVSAGYTLFRLMQEVAMITSDYYASIEPGHILVDSINGKAAYTDPSWTWGYAWKWYYWSEGELKWTIGPVGCDAWMLKDGGVYKWSYEYWQYLW